MSKQNRWTGFDWMYKNMAFLCFLGLLGVAYIFNAHAAEKKIRKIEAMKKEVKEAKWEYMQVKKDIMYGSTMTQVAERVKDSDLKVKRQRPKKISAKLKENGSR